MPWYFLSLRYIISQAVLILIINSFKGVKIFISLITKSETTMDFNTSIHYYNLEKKFKHKVEDGGRFEKFRRLFSSGSNTSDNDEDN